jgi:hypothetical protein
VCTWALVVRGRTGGNSGGGGGGGDLSKGRFDLIYLIYP